MADLSIARAGIPTAEEILEPSPGALLRRRVFGHAGLLIGAITLLTIIFVAVFADVISPGDPYDQILSR
ncbi:MAG: ABC transporter permease, partial [Alphaproteobacteria bacterium]